MNFGDKINFFICLVLILLFQKAQVDEKIYRDEVRVLRLGNYQTCSIFNVLTANNSQMTLRLKHFIINPFSAKLRKSPIFGFQLTGLFKVWPIKCVTKL